MTLAVSGADVVGQVLPGLLAVIGIPLFIYWWMKRGRAGQGRGVRVTARVPFGKSTWVAVVEVDDRRFLVGTGEGGVNLLSELEALPSVAGSVTIGGHDAPLDPYDDTDAKRPWMGLIRRLQRMTVRTPAVARQRIARDVDL